MALLANNQAGLPAPELPPVELNNLLDVAKRGPDSARWERGGGFVDFACFKGNVEGPNCPSDTMSAPQTCKGPAYFSPVLLELSISWDPLSYPEAIKEAEAALERSTSSLLEAEIELGTAAAAATTPILNPKLSGAAVITAPATNDARAVGMVQDYLYDSANGSAAMGTLLMSYEAAIRADTALEIDNAGRVWTKYGKWPVVLGNFTPGVIYGVPGLLDVYLDSIEVVEQFERSTNEMILSAQRLALVTWHTCMGPNGVKVTLAA